MTSVHAFRGDIPDIAVNIGVREGKLYRLKGNPVI
jgi:hypothetical protein